MESTQINSNIGTFELLEIYEYYDGPIIFSCKNKSDSLFFVSSVDENNGEKKWLFLPVSVFKLRQIISGCVAIKAAFLQAEEPWLFEMYGNFAGENLFTGKLLYVTDINHDDLPNEDVCLDDVESSIFLNDFSSEKVLEASTVGESAVIEYNCAFCDQAEMIMENRLAWAKYDKFPVSPGHMLIISRRHVSDYFAATGEEHQAFSDLLTEAKKLLDEKYHPDGYNIGVNCGETAGQTIMHLHIHLIPRYHGDIDNPRGGVRGVIPSKRIY